MTHDCKTACHRFLGCAVQGFNYITIHVLEHRGFNMKLRLTQWVREVRIFAHNKQLESARQTDNEISTLSLHYKPKSKDLFTDCL